MSKNAEGWIRHRGSKCPVEKGTLIDVRFRNGDIVDGVKALERDGGAHVYGWCAGVEFWKKDDVSADIMAYRPHKPAEQESLTATAVEQCAAAFGDSHADVMESVLSRLDGPTQWRDRIAEIDAATQSLAAERAELVQKLASEGFALIGRVVDTSAKKEEWKRHAEEGRKINAIKHYREMYGSSLRDAKDAVELYQSTLA